ncbi:MAG: hypothetical protein PHW32_01940 [Bacilli bacterium]|nr:hypothetical protein [Bacilli bacterium]MDD4282782.1 hypothetical protein [Bacilli bacterium]MDD4718346.1 hypothetical protein [Bacilli bacterium]
MTIKKNTLIVICASTITLILSVFFINSMDVVQFKDNSALAQNQETTNNSKTIDKPNTSDNQNPIINTEEPIDSTKSNKTNDDFTKDNLPMQIEPTYENKEEEVLSYFRILENDTKENTNESILTKVKDRLDLAFFATVDFLFYDKEIKGITFDELSDKAKVEILEIANSIDTMISKQFPTYKETIKDTGNKTYEFIGDQIGKLKNKIKGEIGTEKYNNILDTFEKGKTKLIDLKDSAKDVTGNAWNKAKDWYEDIRENRD